MSMKKRESAYGKLQLLSSWPQLFQLYTSFFLQLQLDINELRSAGDTAQRQKVKDAISVIIRKWETELVEIKDQMKKDSATNGTNEVKSEVKKDVTPKIIESQLKDYCMDML